MDKTFPLHYSVLTYATLLGQNQAIKELNKNKEALIEEIVQKVIDRVKSILKEELKIELKEELETEFKHEILAMTKEEDVLSTWNYV